MDAVHNWCMLVRGRRRNRKTEDASSQKQHRACTPRGAQHIISALRNIDVSAAAGLAGPHGSRLVAGGGGLVDSVLSCELMTDPLPSTVAAGVPSRLLRVGQGRMRVTTARKAAGLVPWRDLLHRDGRARVRAGADRRPGRPRRRVHSLRRPLRSGAPVSHSTPRPLRPLLTTTEGVALLESRMQRRHGMGGGSSGVFCSCCKAHGHP